jgi:two-component system, response regulator PdtaR
MDAKKNTVLIVEDEIIVAMEIEIRLKKNNFIVVGIAKNSEEAIGLALKHLPGLILMDINLRDQKDGIQTSVEILSKIKTNILFVSAYNDDDTLKRIEIIPGSKILFKPFTIGEMISSINSFFE